MTPADCARWARRRAEERQVMRLAGAESALRVQASADWASLRGRAARCLARTPGARAPCAPPVAAYIEWAGALQTALPASVEAVETTCGLIEVDLEGRSVAPRIAELAAAEALLRWLRAGRGGGVTGEVAAAIYQGLGEGPWSLLPEAGRGYAVGDVYDPESGALRTDCRLQTLERPLVGAELVCPAGSAAWDSPWPPTERALRREQARRYRSIRHLRPTVSEATGADRGALDACVGGLALEGVAGGWLVVEGVLSVEGAGCGGSAGCALPVAYRGGPL